MYSQTGGDDRISRAKRPAVSHDDFLRRKYPGECIPSLGLDSMRCLPMSVPFAARYALTCLEGSQLFRPRRRPRFRMDPIFLRTSRALIDVAPTSIAPVEEKPAETSEIHTGSRASRPIAMIPFRLLSLSLSQCQSQIRVPVPPSRPSWRQYKRNTKRAIRGECRWWQGVEGAWCRREQNVQTVQKTSRDPASPTDKSPVDRKRRSTMSQK